MKRLWLVSKEVYAETAAEALKVKGGRVYQLSEASNDAIKGTPGFKSKKKK